MRAVHLDAVELIIKGISSVRAAKIFKGVQLNNLRTLTTNFPHDALSAFLSTHLGITELALTGSCGRLFCPLSTLDPLTQLVRLEGPMGCLCQLAAVLPGIQMINAQCTTSDECDVFLNSLTLRGPCLRLLSMEFFLTDGEILSRISAAAPALYSLRLLEKDQVRFSPSMYPKPI